METRLQIESLSKVAYLYLLNSKDAEELLLSCYRSAREKVESQEISSSLRLDLLSSFFKELRRKKKFSEPHLVEIPPGEHWSLPEIDMSKWKAYRRVADEGECLALLLTRVATFPDSWVARASGLTTGSVAHRRARALRHFSQKVVDE